MPLENKLVTPWVRSYSHKNDILPHLPLLLCVIHNTHSLTLTHSHTMTNAQFKKMVLADMGKYMKKSRTKKGMYDAEDWEDALTAALDKALAKNGGKKKKKDPNAPKGAVSGFMWYSKYNRAKISERMKRKNPDTKFGEVAKEVGRRWKKLSDEEKEKYQKMARKDKKRYDAAMEAYKTRTDAEKSDTETDVSNSDSDTESDPPTRKKGKGQTRWVTGKKKVETSSDSTESDPPTRKKSKKKGKKGKGKKRHESADSEEEVSSDSDESEAPRKKKKSRGKK